jgi:hypothetical protein
MFGSTILDIAIGLIFVYLLMSFLCSAAKELIEGLMRHRASDLENGIMSLLDSNLGASLFNHGLIKGLSQGGARPSYIPAQTFALALMDTVSPGGAENALASPGLPPAATLRAGAAALAGTSPAVSRALVSLIDSAGNDATKVRENIEAWFNSAMDRVSGLYKRRTQYMVFILGLAIVGLMNVDTIRIANGLSHDAALRNSLVATAQEYAKSAPPVTNAPATAAPGTSAPPSAGDQTQAAAKSMEAINSTIASLGLPLGWQKEDSVWADPLLIVQKLLGLLVTALAITLGAPFWFDTLNRAVNVRTAVKPKDK